MDYLESRIDFYLRKGKIGFWSLKKRLKEEGLLLDKHSLLTRIKNITKWKS